MARHDEERAQRLAAALRENLKRRKAQSRLLPGTGRGTATRSGGVEGAESETQAPLHQASPGPPPRPGGD